MKLCSLVGRRFARFEQFGVEEILLGIGHREGVPFGFDLEPDLRNGVARARVQSSFRAIHARSVRSRFGISVNKDYANSRQAGT